MFYFALEQLNKINSVSTLYSSAQDWPCHSSLAVRLIGYYLLNSHSCFFQEHCITKKSNKSIFRMESAGVDIPDIAQKKSQN